ncbi:kinase-like domain-containing protein, partial [Tribonema minus]
MGNSVPSSLTIGHQTIKIKGQIGDGGHGHVYRGEDDAGKDYALKVTWVPRDRNGAVANEEAAETASLEQTILKRICPHPNVIEVLDSGMLKEDNEIRYHILIEYCPRTVLGHLTEARKAPSNYLPERDIMLILRDTLSALQHLHAQTPPIAHRDLRVENLLVDVRGRVRLCNFGSCSLRHRSFAASRDIALAKEEIRRRTAPAYRAPEQVDLHLGHMVSERVDIWAVGVLLHKLAFGATPFEDSRGDVQNLAILGGFRVDRLPEAHPYSSGLCALLQLCMNPIPQARPSCAQLLRR